ncbi:MAG: HAD family hydrolase [Dehalococcoidia bacterium]|nr:HAD family hydrolase [Dehalococcoidia bacterium]
MSTATGTRYAHILLDFDRTLNDSDGVFERNLGGFLGLSGQEVLQGWEAVHREILAKEPRERHEDLDLHYQRILERIAANDSKESLKGELRARVQAAQQECWYATALFPETLPFLQRLADSGATLHLATGDYAQTKAAAIERLAGRTLFQRTFDADTLGVGKGKRDYYDRALESLAIAPGDGVVIGDSMQNDIAPALEVGLATVWVRRKEEKAKDGVAPQCTVANLMDALPHLLPA